MAWADVRLSSPESIGKLEKEINTLTKPAELVTIYDATLTTGSNANIIVGLEQKDISGIKGYGVLEIAASGLTAGTVTITLQHSSDGVDGNLSTYGTVVLIPAYREHTGCLPFSINDYFTVKGAVVSVTGTGKLTISLLSAWDAKHDVAKDVIESYIKTYYTGDLDDIDDYDSLELPAAYYVLHLIYADLMIGFGENEVYQYKMKFYYQQFEKHIKFAIRQLVADDEYIVTSPILSR